MSKLYAVSWVDPHSTTYSYNAHEQVAEYHPVTHKQVLSAESQAQCKQMIRMGFPYAQKIQVTLIGVKDASIRVLHE